MAKLFTRNGKLLTRNGKLLSGEQCCCNQEIWCCCGDCEEDPSTGNSSRDLIEATDQECSESGCRNVGLVSQISREQAQEICDEDCPGRGPVACIETTNSANGVTTRRCENSPDMTGDFETFEECEKECGFLTNVCVPEVTQPEGFVTRGCIQVLVPRKDLVNEDCVDRAGRKCCCCSGFRITGDGEFAEFNTSGSFPIRSSTFPIEEIGEVTWEITGLEGCVRNFNEVRMNISGFVGNGVEFETVRPQGIVLPESLFLLGSVVRWGGTNISGEIGLPARTFDTSLSGAALFRVCYPEDTTFRFSAGVDVITSDSRIHGFAELTGGIGECCECESESLATSQSSLIEADSSIKSYKFIGVDDEI